VWHAWERKEKCTRFWWKSHKERERDHSEKRGADGKTGSEWILGRWAGGVEWIELAQDDRWRALESTVMNLRVLSPRS
jgi:hypothetical protein